jgi:hypothetical protein
VLGAAYGSAAPFGSSVDNAIQGVRTDLAWNSTLNCEDCHYGTPATMLSGHGTANARYMLRDLNGNDTLDAAPADTGLLPRIVAQEGGKVLDVSDTLFTAAEGILWNAQLAWTDDVPWFADGTVMFDSSGTMVGVNFSAHPTSGNGVHNPPFLEALLKASIAFGSSFYNLAPPAGVDLTIPHDPPSAWKR